VDLLRSRGYPPGGEFAQRRPKKPVLRGGAEVVRDAPGQEQLGDRLEGRIEGLGAGVGRCAGSDSSRQLIARLDGPVAR